MEDQTIRRQKIRIVSPAGVVDPDLLDRASARLRNWGFDVTEGCYAREVYGRFAGTEAQRIHDLQEAIDDEDLTAILCSRGGYGLAQIVDKIDFSFMQYNHKWLIGFSDVTILHAALFKLNIPSIHGVMAKHLTEFPDNSDSLKYLKMILEGEFPAYHFSNNEMNREGVGKGMLIGGNLSVLMGLRATPYEPDYENAVLFIEDIEEEAYKIDRMMQNLRLGGVFEKIAGLMVGHFTNCKEDPLMRKSIKQIILDATEGHKFPVAFNITAGHEQENFPMIMGREVLLKVDAHETSVGFN